MLVLPAVIQGSVSSQSTIRPAPTSIQQVMCFAGNHATLTPALLPMTKTHFLSGGRMSRQSLRDNLNQAAAKGAADGILRRHTPVYFVSAAR